MMLRLRSLALAPLSMTGLLIFLVVGYLFFPLHVYAEQITAEWFFRTENDIRDWHYAGLEEGTLNEEGLVFSVTGQAAIFRALPEGFHQDVDGIEIFLRSGEGLETSLQLIEVGESEQVLRRLRIAFTPGADTRYYIPLTFYRRELEKTNTLVVSFTGNASEVTFGGVRFIHYSLWEKFQGAWKNYWTLEPLRSHMVNVLIGPVVVPDPRPSSENREMLPLRTSVNAYFILFLALAGIALLFFGVFLARFRNLPWRDIRRMILIRLFFCIGAVWIFYDVRMGLEFLYGVRLDQEQYISRSPETRTFRDLGRFYDFTAFAKPHVSDREWYELFAPDAWQYFGLMQYFTYPSLPNDGDPVSDTWVVYGRSDITIGSDQRLYYAGQAFTRNGTILGRFDDASFVFREAPL